MRKIDLNYVLESMSDRGFKVFSNDSKMFNLNIVAIRTQENKVNVFNDWLCVFWKFKGTWNFLKFLCTTDPGLYWLGYERMGNPEGTAMLIEQQVLGMLKWGRHKNYAALEQIKAAKYVRDYNRDDQLNPDLSKIYTGIIKTNIHRASQWKHTVKVGAYSAGCVVLANPIEFELLGNICKRAKKEFENKFTFSLIDERLS